MGIGPKGLTLTQSGGLALTQSGAEEKGLNMHRSPWNGGASSPESAKFLIINEPVAGGVSKVLYDCHVAEELRSLYWVFGCKNVCKDLKCRVPLIDGSQLFPACFVG